MAMHLEKRIRERVQAMYAEKNTAIDWNNWMWSDHVLVVTEYAESIAKREQCCIENTIVAAYLHDIAFSKMRKDDPLCDTESRRIALLILEEEGVSPERSLDIVDNIIAPHGMQGDVIPSRTEALVLSTADGLAHLTTNFYYTLWEKKYLFEKKSSEEFREWILQKLERYA